MGWEGSAQITGIAVIFQPFPLGGVQMYCTEVGGFFVAFSPPPRPQEIYLPSSV